MAPVLLISSFFTLFGLTCFNVDVQSYKLQFSYLKCVYSVILVILISIGLYHQLNTYLEYRLETNLLNGILFMYPMVINCLMSLLIILSSIYSSYTFVQFGNAAENEFILKSTKINLDYKTARIEIISSLIIFCFPYLIDNWYYYSNVTNTSTIYRPLSYIFVLYNYLSLNMFCLSLITLRTMFKSINNTIQKLCHIRIGVTIDEFTPICFKNMTPFEKLEKEFMASDLVEGAEEVEELFLLRGQHHQLCKMSRALNDMYALTNLALVAHHGILGVVNSYWGLRQTLSKHTGNDVAELIHTFRTAVLSFMSIIWLVAPTIFLTAEVERTKKIIQKSMIISKNKSYQSEIKTFSLQLKLDAVLFSPFGFFELSNELLLSILSAIVSYLVILLQYQIMLDEQA